MSTILNNYAHGYVTIPVILACKTHGLFKILNLSKPLSFTDVVKELKANSGHLRTALHMLESLKWVSRNNKDEYVLTPEAAIHQEIPHDMMDLMSFPMKDYLNKNQDKHSLERWFERSGQRWHISGPMIANFLDGMLVMPLLLALKENQLLNSPGNQKAPLFSKLTPAVREEITAFFIHQGWLSQQKGAVVFTDTGRFIAERIFITAAVASYKPILSNISEVIFGDCRSVFERDRSDNERHVDHTLNVIASGFQQEKYFSDMEEIILSLFNWEPYGQQPKYIADTGCGDGTLLKRIYEIVKNKSLRGKVLNEYPVKLIGIDFNNKALEETSVTLKDIDHLLLKGDTADPEQVIKDLNKNGIRDTENILHIRSFLDHERPYVPPADTAAANVRSNIQYEGVYVNREGNAIPAASVIQSLVEHLRKWSGVIGGHGLVVLEVHCLEPKVVSQYIDQSESLHFDACHRFSQQLLVEADRFLMAAAEAGLFPHPHFFRKYPKTMPFSRVTLNHFQRRDYRVRYAHENDLPALVELEKQCWAPGLRKPSSVLKKRLRRYPEGQLVLEMGHNVVGAIYSQRCNKAEDLKTASIETVERLHQKDGAVVQLLAVNILPEMQQRNLGDQLLEFMLQRCSLMAGIHTVIGVTRFNDYHKYADITPQEYINLRSSQGRVKDTNLRFHQLHGAQIKGLIPNYRPKDTRNKGYGVLIEYDLYQRQRDEISLNGSDGERTGKKEAPNTEESIESFIVKTICSILGKKGAAGFSLQRPLMEMGLDSAHLSELNEQVRYRYQISLEPTFFFVHNTAARIISYLQKHLHLVKEETVTPVPGITSPKQSPQKNYDRTRGSGLVSPDSSGSSTSEREIAVIGVACRLPGGINSKDRLWELLISGKDVIGKMPPGRWHWPSNIDPDHAHRGIDRGGFLDEIAAFDAPFFRVSPKEAELMDPQQRILLELSWECLEDAGYTGKALSGGKTGVFIGASGSDYNKLLDRHLEEIDAHFGLGTSMAVLPNRVSYFYDFSGPSLQIDTACSASLAAVHEAVTSLQRGECQQALAGGIHIMCHPANSIAYYKAGMLAKDGKCKTFDKDADGYGRGEGAVIILLKPLPRALCDQDTIYAVIKGSAINHGGQAGGLTVPNPAQQAALLMEAFTTAGVEPETIGYIETHGTGTALGDPIEISGLKEAFSWFAQTKAATQKPHDTGDRLSCGLGSIKTNIGHLEAAAGIAGLLKVILSLRHQMLPASLNFKELNPHITLAETPFYIVDKHRPWTLPEGRLLRRAGVSSFGSGGANAHVVLEEAPGPQSAKRKAHEEKNIKQGTGSQDRGGDSQLIFLSAKTEDALRQKERDLELWLEKHGPGSNLVDISATLLLGREHFAIRSAFVVKSAGELQEKLKEVREKGETGGYFNGRLSGKGKQTRPLFEEFGQTIINHLHASKKKDQEYHDKLMALAELYVKGCNLDWNVIYTHGKIRRINLPTYPFSRKNYWLPGLDPRKGSAASLAKVTSIHPLLQQNTSDFSQQRFSSIFTGEEFFLADHVIMGQRFLPGVAFLEMARAAVALAVGGSKGGQTQIRLKNVVWVQPLAVGDQPVRVHIGLSPGNNGQVAYEIYSRHQEFDKESGTRVYSQGSAIRSLAAGIKEAPSLDLPALQARCTRGVLNSTQCYEAFRARGLYYGPGHQGIEAVYLGSDQVLARLSLPPSVSGTRDRFVLHPSVMDSALQASLILMMGPDSMMSPGSLTPPGPPLPFALEELEILGNCMPTMWALVRTGNGSSAGDKTQKLDIDLCDDQGKIQVRLKGFSSRTLGKNLQTGCMGTFLLTPVWDGFPPEKGQTFPSPDHRLVIVGGAKNIRSAIRNLYPNARPVKIQPEDNIDAIAKKLEAQGPIDHILWIAPHHPAAQGPSQSAAQPPPGDDENNQKLLQGCPEASRDGFLEKSPPGRRRQSIPTAGAAVIKEQDRGVIQVFRMIKAVLGLGYGARELGWTVITFNAQPIHKHENVNAAHASVHGLIGSMAQEYPGWKVRLIDLEADGSWPLDDMFTLPPDPRGNARGYRDRQWYRQRLIPVQSFPLARTPYRPGGVYVVIGGAGGIGEVWSEYMIRTYQARIIWIDRRPKDAAVQAKLDALAALGHAPLYITADATSQEALNQAYEEIKQQYPRVHGVIHSAIVLRDQSLANIEEERFRAALSAKVEISVRLARVFSKETLDFVLFFSSILSFMKAPGQSNYASGCTFKDAFAHQLSHQGIGAVRVINWGYWGSVGVVASKTYRERMAQAGIGSIEPPEAMSALETLLAGPLPQIVFIKTIKPSALEGINGYPQELISVYPPLLPSTIRDLRNRLQEENPAVQQPEAGDPGEMKAMEDLLCKLLWGQLQASGLFKQENSLIADLKTKTGIRDLYHRWLQESMAILAGREYLHCDGDSCKVSDTTPIDPDELWNEWDSQKRPWLENPDTKARVVLLETSLRALPEILTGKVLATDILFPNSSMELVAGIYQHHRVADYFNEVLADAAAAYIQERLKHDSSASIRILEIGAGTGGTSAMFFAKLEPYRAQIREYCYTDISKAFLLHAEEEYGRDNPYLTYQRFDVEEPLAGQGIAAGEYDIVIATNVLHATRNIRKTLRNTKTALKNNGLLLLNEMSDKSLFLHLTFGLLPGWWRYEDQELRIPGSPGLSPETWQMVLESEGFPTVFFPVPGAHDLGQQLIVAESDGVVRQPHGMGDLLKETSLSSETGENNKKFLQVNHESRGSLARGVYPSEGRLPLKAKSREPGAKSHSSHAPISDQMAADHVKDVIIENLSASLKVDIDTIDVDEAFADYGLDSITGVRLVELINQALNIELVTTTLFDYSSVNKLAAYILSQHKDTISAGLGQEGTREQTPLHKDINHDLSPGSTDKPKDFVYSNPRCFPEGNETGEKDFIAIIGMSGRFAGSRTLEDLWGHLAKGHDLVEEVSRWDLSTYYPDSSQGEINYCNYGSFLDDIDRFDPGFFNLSGREATYMDPQQRFFLEESWKALEDAGYAGEGVQGRQCGVYVGCAAGDYPHLFKDKPPAQAFWGNAGSVIPARIAYHLDLQGPALAVDTACSSSLVAVHLACQGLGAGEIELALAGGVFLQCTPAFHLAADRAGMLSLKGRCYTFDQRADGFVPGEGVGVVVLKRLKAAIRDGDHIYGVIRGSGINQDGTTNGITAPSANSQERLERQVYDTFNINPQQVQMVEAHGTGTILGDPIEYQALTEAFGKYTDKKEYCAIGSIKTNIGHTVFAAGIAGLIRVLLSLKHRQIPPSLHYQSGNSNIRFKESPFYVNTTLKDWECEAGTPRCAVVSSFGFSGTNAHLVVGEAPASVRQSREKPGYLMVLSARTSEQLRQQAGQLLEFCQQKSPPGADCGNISYTLLLGRKHFHHRLACVVRSQAELTGLLQKWLEKGKVSQIYISELPENQRREQPALKQYGNQCIQHCQTTDNASEYLEHLAAIADLYIQGYALEYRGLFSDEGYSRISLPAYPFARERFWVPGTETGISRTAVKAAAQAAQPTSPPSLTLAGSNFSNSPDKPRKISLQPLSAKPIPSKKPADQPRPLTTLTSPGISLSPPGSGDESGLVAPVQSPIPMESLLEKLSATLAEALYIKRNAVDVDKTFVSMGLDSIIGVEWTRAINKHYGTSITATRVYDYPTLREFAGFLSEELKKQGGQPPIKSVSSPPASTPPQVSQQPAALPSIEPAGGVYPGQSPNSRESIAIVGMSGRYPGARDLGQYWHNLVRAKNSIKEIPGFRWDVNRYYDPRPMQKGKVYCRWLGLLEDIEYFDPLFFNIPPAEAALMDPQHRLFLQEGYKAFEDAGYNCQLLSNKKCGVYLGIMSNEYGSMLAQNQLGLTDTTGNSFAIAAARLPYYLNLKGPAIPIDTACSSSLTATHLACQALLNHEIDMALVGGVSLYLTPGPYLGMCAAGMLSPRGQCKPFDDSADGFVPGEGVGALVLKRLTEARTHGDSIYGVIIGSGINHDGKTNGITAPNRSSQIQLEREVYDKHQIDPGSINYIETHGTGTKLGDLIELEALSTVFKEKSQRKNYCALGSVKGNIGHTSAAAGVASIQKVLLSMRHKKLVPTLNFTRPNEHFDFEDSPFYVNTGLRTWEVPPGLPRRAGVSSFGFSGTNAHIVIEEPHGMGDLSGFAPTRSSSSINLSSAQSGMNSSPLPGDESRELRTNILFILSAKSKKQLGIYAGLMKGFIESHQDLDLVNLAYTLQVGRESMDHRLAVLADSPEALINALEGFINNNAPPGVLTGQVNKNEEGVEEFAADEDPNALWKNPAEEKNLEQAAALWVKGLNVDWHLLYREGKPNPPQRISLPTYPFARERCWIPGTDTLAGNAAANPVFVPETYIYDEPFLKDHTIHNRQVLIGVTHASLALNAFFKLFPEENSVHLHRLDFVKPIEVDRDRAVEVLVKPVQKESILNFQVMYREVSSTAWNLTAAGNLQKTHLQSRKPDLESIKDSLTRYQRLERVYTGNPGIGLGDSFKTITHLYIGKEQALARVALTQAAREKNHEYVLHPLITNSAFLAIFPLIEPFKPVDTFLPFGIKDLHFRKTSGLDNCWVLVKLVKYSGEMIVFDAEVVDEESRVVVYYSGCSMKRLRAGSQFPVKERQKTGSNTPQPQLETRINKIQKYLVNKLAKIVPQRSTLSHLEFNLMDMGLKSSQLVELTNEIAKETGIELFPTLFFEYPNIKELTEFFSREHRGPFMQLLGSSSTGPGGPGTDVQRPEPIPSPPKVSQEVLTPPLAGLQTLPCTNTNRDIAVIGMSALFAGSPDLDKFWIHLRDQSDLIKEIPIDHWDYRPWFDRNPEAEDKTYCKWGSFIQNVDHFDAEFFNISPLEAEWMDPQLRLLLQSVYAAGEDAGYGDRLRGTDTGVFVGVCCHDYADKITELNLPRSPYLGTGNLHTVIANRVSFTFDFTGPSIAVDTACSSSLFALHYACHALRSRECSLAFVGGVNLLLSSLHYRYFSSIGALSPTGRCFTFDERADGYIPGEGIATILLKPLSQAQRDGDHIYAIIKGSAALHAGYTPSFTAPGVTGEENVMVKAWDDAGINPETLSYLEAHGTGTKLGDPIEINALKNAFKRFTAKEGFCALGSVKANIGHTEGAAGIAGVLKVILQMKHRQIPVLPHFKTLNPYVRLEQSALYINRELEEWKSPAGVPRRAGVNSFGLSGAYAHVVLEEYTAPDRESSQTEFTSREPAIIVLSARNVERLQEKVRQLLAAFAAGEQQDPGARLTDIAYTLQVGREAMEERLAVIVASLDELREKLEGFLEKEDSVEGLYRGQVKRTKETLPALAADEDMAKTIAAWIEKGKYEKLADLWVKGLVFDWDRLYSGSKDYKPRRISLPTYPFARERYWVEAPLSAVTSADKGPPEARVLCFLSKQWEPVEPAPGPDPLTGSLNRTIAILTTLETKSLAAELSRHFPRGQILFPHDLKSQLRQPEHLWKNYDGCVDLTGCGKDKNDSLDWIAWLQLLVEKRNKGDLMLLYVTRALESYQNNTVNLSGASRVGLYRMLQSEYRYLRSRHMDADPGIKDKKLARQIAAEFLIDSEDSEICYRDGKRCRAYLREIQTGDENPQPLVFPGERVLLITGGTRGIGYLCAQHFVTHYGVKRLVLTGQEALPPREQWDVYGQQKTAAAEKIQAVQTLEARGVQVNVLSLSLTDPRAVKKSLEEIKRTMGPIGGVIHSAGTRDLENLAFIRKSISAVQQVLEPKVTGLDTLIQCLVREPLQFFILFSSVAAIIPGLAPGLSDYVMANTYMDYTAEANLQSCHMVSIQWPNWKETGIGEVKSGIYEQTGLLSLTNTEGLQLLDQILTRQMGPVVLPAVVNPVLWKPRQLMRRSIARGGTARSRSAPPGAAALTDSPDALVKATQARLVSLFSKELKMDPARLEIGTLFQDYGIDSILLAQLLRAIKRHFAVPGDLDPSILYEYSTIKSLAAWLAANYPASLSAALAMPEPGQPGSREQDSLSPSKGLTRSLPGRESKRGLGTDIAVIGLSCRFPGASTLDEYWDLLSSGRSAIGPVPRERWVNSNHFYAGLLHNVTHFDPKFFLIPETDARAMDPQALLVLEESLNLFYHAGYSHHEIKGKPMGVFLGARSRHRPDESDLGETRNPIVAVGQNYLATNISQFFDLRGPSLVLDTACSSALVGMNMAIQALHGGEIESALVGGVSLLNTDEAHRIFQQRRILSQGPSFHIFDQRASGVVLGEGVGLVLLKTLGQAIEDGDHIYAVIPAVAINNDGRTAGPATPNLQAQKEVLQAALDKSGKKPEEISYIEVNGSGSQVTDLLELKAIHSIYRSSNSIPCGLGSMKPNIGHPLCAEGIASFIKVVLMLQQRKLVPFLSGEQPMKHYNIETSPFYFCRKLTGWNNIPRIAGVNCFADGGTNAHAILEAWEEPASPQVKRNPLPPPKLNRQPIQQKNIKISDNHEETQGFQISKPVSGQMVWDSFN